MICGALAPSSGQITINGIDLLDKPKTAKANLGYLPESPPLHLDSTVDEYLIFCARLHRMNRTEVQKAILLTKQRCGLEHVSRRRIGNLSKGYQQRIGIAQAILHSPSIVILDEPTVGLDPIQLKEVRSLIQDLGQNQSVILSTHIVSEIQEICNKVQIMHQGKIVLQSGIDELESQITQSSLILATHEPIPESTLSNIAGVKRIESFSASRFRIFFQKSHNPSQQLARTVVNSGFGLLELSPEQTNIEEIFLQLTKPASSSATSSE